MRIVTIVGKGCVSKEGERPSYKYDEKLQNLYSLKKQRYTNMLPLLIDNFGVDILVPIFTKEAKKSQKEVLESEFEKDYSYIFNDNNFIQNEKDFYEILRIINESILEYDEYIIDLTHGFRHIPILTTISLITKGIKKSSNIKHIFFAKEIEPRKQYEIIDLKEYLELANMSYMLEMFNENYTVSAISNFENEDFEDLRGELNKFSNHILSNSLKALDADFDRIIYNIDKIQKNEHVAIFKITLNQIQEHMKELQAISKKAVSEKLYEMAKILSSRGYLLNSITLLFEAVGNYCVEGIKCLSPDVKSHIQNFERLIENSKNSGDFTVYQLVHQSRNFIKYFNGFKGIYLNPNKKNEELQYVPKEKNSINKIHYNIVEGLKKIKNIRTFSDFIKSIEKLRNNLAHANSSKEIKNSKSELDKLFEEYQKFCIDEDILGVK